jgi:molybdopterin molybdotransferase
MALAASLERPMPSEKLPISVKEAVKRFAVVTAAEPKLVPIEAAIGHRVADEVRTLRAVPEHDIAKDAVVVEAGERITLTSAFACAVCGVTEVMVRKPVVDVIFCASADIRDQQRMLPIIASVIRANGAAVGSVQFLMTNVTDIAEALTSSSADVFYVVGGVSPETGTCAVEAIRTVGSVHYHGVRMRPAGDSVFGTIDGRPIVGVASSMPEMLASNAILMRFFARRVFGRPDIDMPLRQAKLASPVTSDKQETTVIFAQVSGDVILPLGTNPDPLNFAKANSVIILAEGARRPRQGDRVNYLPLNIMT